MEFYVVAVRDDEEEIVSGPYQTRTEARKALERASQPREGYLAVREWEE